jgi:adenylate kinase
LASQYGIPQIATGDMLRQAQRDQTEVGLQVKDIMQQGNLIPDELMIEIVKDRLCANDCQQGFLLDGFPRTLAQADALRKHDIYLDHVIEIQVSDACVIERLTGRRVHPSSGRTYHVVYQPPKQSDCDDVTGEPLVQRDDDSEETVKKRLKVYHDQTSPLVDYYRQWAVSEPHNAPHYHAINGEQPVNVVREALMAILT